MDYAERKKVAEQLLMDLLDYRTEQQANDNGDFGYGEGGHAFGLMWQNHTLIAYSLLTDSSKPDNWQSAVYATVSHLGLNAYLVYNKQKQRTEIHI